METQQNPSTYPKSKTDTRRKITQYIPAGRTTISVILAFFVFTCRGCVGDVINEQKGYSLYLLFIVYVMFQFGLMYFKKKYWQWRITKVIFWSGLFWCASFYHEKIIRAYQEQVVRTIIETEDFVKTHGYYPDYDKEFCFKVDGESNCRTIKYPFVGSGRKYSFPIRDYRKSKPKLPKEIHFE